MRTRSLIKTFTWHEQDRDDVTLGTSTRLNPDTHRAQLEVDSVSGKYPTSADLYVKSRLTSPQSVRSWTGFQAYILHKTNFQNAAVTSAQFRLDDDTDEWYWTGAAWAVASASDWNTEQEIADNITTFDAVDKRQLAVVINLVSADGNETPEVVWVKVLYEAAIDSFVEDMVYRSLIPLIRANVRPIARAGVSMPATGTTLNISDLELEAGYNVVGVDSVFDHTNDPDHLVDLFSSYAAGVITLTGSIAIGVTLLVRFIYSPVVAVTTSQDYVDVERVPSITLADVGYRGTAVRAPSGEDHVANTAVGTTVVVPSPLQGDLGFTLMGHTDKAVDNQRLLEQVNAFFANTPFIRSTALDERYRLQLIDEYAVQGEPGQSEIHMGRATFLIRNFRQWLEDAFDDHVVTDFQLTLSSA